MRTRGFSLLLAGTMALGLLLPASAQAATDKIQVTLAGETLELGQEPFVHQNRTYVPLRAIFEKLGAEVAWDAATQTVTATKGDVVVELTMNSKTAYRNEVPVELDAAPMTRDNHLYVPVRFIAESFNNPVQWAGATKTVQIEASNRMRIEELLNQEAKDVRSGHVHTRMSVVLFEEGGTVSEGIQDVSGDYVVGADGLYDVHYKVQRSGDLMKDENSYELYAKGDRVYVAFNGFNRWLTSLREKAPGLISSNVLESDEIAPVIDGVELAKYATLNEDGPTNVLTFRFTREQFFELSGESYFIPEGPPVTMIMEFQKGTQYPLRAAYDYSVEADGSGVTFEILIEYDKYNQVTEITVPAHVLNAEEADLSQSE